MSGPATIVQSDEEMAAAMQERYRRDFLDRQSRRGHSGRVAPVDVADEERKRQEEADAALARRLAMEAEGPAARPSSGGPSEDERLARRLHDEEMMRRYGGVAEQAPARTPFVASLYGSGMGVDADADAARRVAQEMDDEDIARRYNTYEREAAARRQAILVEDAIQRKRRRRRCLVLPLCLVVVAVVIVALFTTGILDRDDLPDFDGIDWIDPFEGEVDIDIQDPNSAFAWDNKGNGLELDLLNALDDSYQSVYEIAIRNWDNGDPDSLTLSTERIPYESECSTVSGKLKVCNGNYGATRWRGLNEILHTRKRIYASTAKLNDYYLRDGPEGQKLYTTCHEIGHGFGLPHWDENFYNMDLGNCMDYTDEPEKNATPDRSNFEFLAEVYGTTGGQRRLRGLHDDSPKPSTAEPFPEWLMEEYRVARQELETMLASDDGANRGGWRRLEADSSEGRLETHQRHLGQGYTLQVHLLLA